jgi:hypothetical protein
LALNRWFLAAFVALVLIFTGPTGRSQSAGAAPNLPDTPLPSPQQTSPPSNPPLTGQSDSKPPLVQSVVTQDPEEIARKKAQEQLQAQEKQRVFGVMATFNTTRNKDALPLSTGQKYQLFFKSASDPWPFLLSGFLSGIDQADNAFPEYGQGMQGYAKRFGASYTDYFTGNLLGNAVLASLMKEDPRYFQRGTGSYTVRALWAASGTVWCKRDNGTWGPNYANVLGNLMGAAVSNLYYPQSDRTVGGTVSRGFSVTAQAIIGSEVIEFWPDIVRHHRRKQAEKLARQSGVKTISQPAPQSAAPAAPSSQP